MADIITAYQEIPEERRHSAAEELHEQVCADAQRVASAMLDFCRSLKTMRDTKLYAELGCASFDEYVEQKVGLKRRQVYNYIQTYERLGSTILQSNAHLGITKLQLLCEISAPDIPAFLEENDLAGMTVAEMKKLIAERDGQAEQISLLQEQVRELERRPVDVAVAEPDHETICKIRKEVEAKWKEREEKRREEYDRITATLRADVRAAREEAEEAARLNLEQASRDYEKAEKEKEELRRIAKKAEEKLAKEKEKRDKEIKKAEAEAEKKLEEVRKETAERVKTELSEALSKAEAEKAAAIEEAKKMAERMNKTADADLITANFHLGAIKESLHNLADCIRKIRTQDPEKAENVSAAVKKILDIAVSKMEDE